MTAGSHGSMYLAVGSLPARWQARQYPRETPPFGRQHSGEGQRQA
jgi:hypothetical protein